MNRNSYRRFYNPGAYAYWELSQKHKLHQHRYANFQKFLDANLGVVPVGNENICCQQFIHLSGRYKCESQYCYANSIHIDRDIEDIQPKVQVSMYDEIFDHSHMMRIKGVRKSYFAATHPYSFDTEKVSIYPKGLLQGLVAKVYPKEKDWYVPEASNLILIGTPETLKHLDLSGLGTPTAEIIGTLPVREPSSIF